MMLKNIPEDKWSMRKTWKSFVFDLFCNIYVKMLRVHDEVDKFKWSKSYNN